MKPDHPILGFNAPANEYSPKQSFSVLEIILLLILMAVILSGFLLPIYYYYSARTVYTKAMATKVMLINTKQALMAFEVDCERFPTTSEGLAVLVDAPIPTPSGWHRYVDRIPKDGWGRPLLYTAPDTNGADFDLYSLGEDATDGTKDDIHLRDLK